MIHVFHFLIDLKLFNYYAPSYYYIKYYYLYYTVFKNFQPYENKIKKSQYIKFTISVMEFVGLKTLICTLVQQS